jgi:hypothetical protein
MMKSAQSCLMVAAALASFGACSSKETLGSNTKDDGGVGGAVIGAGGAAIGAGGADIGAGGAVIGAGGAIGDGSGGISAMGGAVGYGGAGVGGATGTGGARDAGTDGPFQCEYQGKYYNVGQTRGLSDCNYCECWSTGWACTGMICGTGGAQGAGGKVGAGGTGAGGATGTGGSCVDAAVKARYSSCMATKDVQSCTDAGGTWRSVGSPGVCMCPTGQEGCPCTGSSDCLSFCGVAAETPSKSCTGVTGFACLAGGGMAGCWCRPGDTYPVCPM